MKKIKFLATFTILLATLLGCTKVIDLKLGNDSGKLVIEGNITNLDSPQYIKLSRNVPFTSTNTYPAVTGAAVSITDSLGHNYQFWAG